MSSRRPKSTEQKKTGLCFVLSPIGSARSSVRERSDKILKHIIKPACRETGFDARRADEIREPGLISTGVIQGLLQAEMVVADLTGHNPNVFYELGIRHFTGKPVVQLIEEAHDIPFDLFDTRTIKFNYQDLDSVEAARLQLVEFIKHCDHEKSMDNPVTRVMRQLGIPLPTPVSEGNSAGIPEMFQDLTSRILSELKIIRAERNVLVTTALKSQVKDKQRNNSQGNKGRSGDLAGVWNSNNGLVRIAHSGDTIVGQYQYGGNWVGSMVGEQIGDRIVVRWQWDNQLLSGVACFRCLSKNKCVGGWWYTTQTEGFEKLVASPTIADQWPITAENRWELWRGKAQVTSRRTYEILDTLFEQ
ncbi:MAG: hypothetical protein IPP12_13810 [Nitrospira sp.]|nr:hypothetical protein [Nitrospira sp.]